MAILGNPYWNTSSTLPSNFKKRVFSSDDSDFRALEKHSMASCDMKFVFVSFLMIIPISQSKRGSRTTLHSDSTGAITSKWRFLKFLYHEYILPYARYSKREFSQVTIATSGPSKKNLCSFSWLEICVCKAPHDHTYLPKQMGWSYDA